MKRITNYKDILVLTTSSIEGYKILEYKKPVSSHVVTGVNIFNDFFGGLSDVFGGRSNEFQNQLSSIYNESITKLQQEAFRLGCNCIIGLKVDIDEISGKGKSMFMITSIGTAILIENISSKEITNSRILSVDELNNLLNKERILIELKENKLGINSDIWESLISNQIKDAFDSLLERYRKYIESFATNDNEFYVFESNFLRYIEVLDIEFVCDKLYTSIAENDNTNYIKHCYDVIQNNYIIHLPSIAKLLEKDILTYKKTATTLSKYNKQHYQFEDIKEIKNLIFNIETKINENVEYLKKKKNLFSSDEIEVWKCQCGNTNNKQDEFCNGCLTDKYGFNKNSYNKKTAITNLKWKLRILEERLE